MASYTFMDAIGYIGRLDGDWELPEDLDKHGHLDPDWELPEDLVDHDTSDLPPLFLPDRAPMEA